MSDDPNKLRAGDVVRIKNIVGPRMLITGFDAKDHSIVCLKWFNRRYELETEWFHVKHLAKFNPGEHRPTGLRGALMAIRDKAFSGGGAAIWMDDETPLRLFIDHVLANGYDVPIDPTRLADPVD
jgi:uncharacterized protein YodC (DUF2158 family)